MNPFIKALQENDLKGIKAVTDLIMVAIAKSAIKDSQLSDEQKKEFVLTTRDTIYDTLVALTHCDIDSLSMKLVEPYAKAIPIDWREPQLSPALVESILGVHTKKIKFQSAFLNEQYKLENIIYNPMMGGIQIIESFNFIDVKYGDRAKHRDKTAAQLRKEGYKYDSAKGTYIKVL